MTKPKKKALLWLIIPLAALFIISFTFGIAAIFSSISEDGPFDSGYSDYPSEVPFDY